MYVGISVTVVTSFCYNWIIDEAISIRQPVLFALYDIDLRLFRGQGISFDNFQHNAKKSNYKKVFILQMFSFLLLL